MTIISDVKKKMYPSTSGVYTHNTESFSQPGEPKVKMCLQKSPLFIRIGGKRHTIGK